MRITAERLQRIFQLEERCARMADDLPAFIDQADLRQVERTHDHDITIIVGTIRVDPPVRPVLAACMMMILFAAAQTLSTPIARRGSRTDDGQRRSVSTPEAGAVTARAFLAG